jgi:hypothetical protein
MGAVKVRLGCDSPPSGCGFGAVYYMRVRNRCDFVSVGCDNSTRVVSKEVRTIIAPFPHRVTRCGFGALTVRLNLVWVRLGCGQPPRKSAPLSHCFRTVYMGAIPVRYII